MHIALMPLMPSSWSDFRPLIFVLVSLADHDWSRCGPFACGDCCKFRGNASHALEIEARAIKRDPKAESILQPINLFNQLIHSINPPIHFNAHADKKTHWRQAKTSSLSLKCYFGCIQRHTPGSTGRQKTNALHQETGVGAPNAQRRKRA